MRKTMNIKNRKTKRNFFRQQKLKQTIEYRETK